MKMKKQTGTDCAAECTIAARQKDKGIRHRLRQILIKGRQALFFCSLCCSLLLLFFSSPCGAQTCKDSIVATTPDSRFTPHKDGTVTHIATGLMWMRCSVGQKWDGKTCTGEAVSLDWQKALQAADQQAFAGHSDWRLPNKNELASIMEERCTAPAINDKIFPNTPAVFFWSSSPYTGLADGAWSLDFGYGSINASVKSGNLHLRLVRGEGRR